MKHKLDNENINIESEFIEKLKELEKDSVSLEVEIDRLKEEKVPNIFFFFKNPSSNIYILIILMNFLIDQTDLLDKLQNLNDYSWRKIKLEKEMQETLNPEVVAGIKERNPQNGIEIGRFAKDKYFFDLNQFRKKKDY